MPENNLFLVVAVGILCLILALSSAMVIWQFVSGKGGKEPTGRIPPNMQFFLAQSEAMTVVRAILTREKIVGASWRVTYDKNDEGRIQARLYGRPTGAPANVDVLLNMIFHRLEPFKTELEWSFVVMGGPAADADRVVDASNAAFRRELKLAQFDKSTPAGKFGGAGGASGGAVGANGSAAESTPAAQPAVACKQCSKILEPGFSYCIYCGANVA